MEVICIDVGSPRNIGWADSHGSFGNASTLEGVLFQKSEILRKGGKIALGFEAPLWTPRRSDLHAITQRRQGLEARLNRPWSAGAGTCVMGAALALMPWCFDRISKAAGHVRTTVDLAKFQSGKCQLFVWEAFVSGTAKGSSRHADARLAAEAFLARWPDIQSDIPPEAALNHAVSSAMAANLAIDPSELTEPCLVVGVISRTASDHSEI